MRKRKKREKERWRERRGKERRGERGVGGVVVKETDSGGEKFTLEKKESESELSWAFPDNDGS